MHAPSELPPASRRRFLPAGVVLLAVLTAVSRWLTRTPLPYNWDSVQYVLGVRHYSVLDHQPHPPGSWYYIQAARLARLLVHDPHEALLWVGILAAGATVLLAFALARELAGESAGWLASLTCATAPLFWFFGSVGLNYVPTGALTALFAWACVRICLGRVSGWEPLAAGAALGIVGGFRPTDEAFLAPAYLFSLGCLVGVTRGKERALAAAGSLGTCAALTAGWLVPNILSAGGIRPYREAMEALQTLFSGTSVFLAGRGALLGALTVFQGSLEGMLGALALAAAAGAVVAAAQLRRRRKWEWEAAAGLRVAALGFLIVVPATAFFLLAHFNSTGYTLVYAPFLVAVAAALAAPIAHGRGAAWKLAAVAVLLAASNAAFFLRGRPGRPALGHRAMTGLEIRDHARYYTELAAFVRATYRPGEVRIMTSWEYTDGLRVLEEILPEYRNDVVQAVTVAPHPSPLLTRLSFLHLRTPAQVRSGGVPIIAVARTADDAAFHRAMFGDTAPFPIGPGHVALRISSLEE